MPGLLQGIESLCRVSEIREKEEVSRVVFPLLGGICDARENAMG